MKIMIVVASIVTVLLFVGWLGLQIQPKQFEPFAQNSSVVKTVPLPKGLPAPVERFYKTVYGENVPVVDTVVVKGRAVISPFGIKFPARFIFVHNAGKDYRHYIEATWFGIPFMKVNESYVVGNSHF